MEVIFTFFQKRASFVPWKNMTMTDVIIAKIKTLWFFRPAHYFVIKSLNIFFSNIFLRLRKKFSEVNVHPEIKWILCCSISSSVVVMQESFDKVLRCCSFASLTQKDAFPRISMTHYTGVHNWSSNDLSLDLWLVSSWSIRPTWYQGKSHVITTIQHLWFR